MTNAPKPYAKEEGATLVEFAILAPLLFMLLFGIVEMGWLFARNVDVGHGAREGGRLAIVDFGDETAIVTETCNRMNLAALSDPTSVQVTLARSDGTGNGSANDVGDFATVTVVAPGTTLTGILDWAIPSGLQLTSTAEIRVEQTPSWTTGTFSCP
jgi:Flp pilus assembly protein TadG